MSSFKKLDLVGELNVKKLPTETLFSTSFYKKLLADLQDENLAWKVSSQLGGQRLYIPYKIHKSKIFKSFGESFCDWLKKNYGGEQLVIPLGPSSPLKRRSHQAIIMAQKGYSMNDIARTLGYSHRQVARKKTLARKITEKVSSNLSSKHS